MDGVPRRVPSSSENHLSATTVGSVVQAGVVHGDVHVVGTAKVQVTPRQLPTRIADFVGRRTELDQLDMLVDRAVDTVVIAAVNGTPGIGKTALALRWAHAARTRFPDGQLYVDLRGFDRQNPLTSSQALHGFLLSLGIAPEAVPADLASKAALYRSLLHSRRVLVVLDNARDSEQARPLLPGSPGCAAIVTSRDRLDGLAAREGAHQISLDLLTSDEAMILLERRIGADRTAREQNAAMALVKRCARLPLALTIAAARTASRPRASLAELVDELSDESALLDGFDLGENDLDLRAVLSWSYKALPAPTQRTFRLLGLHAGPDIGDMAVASLIGEPLARARSYLSRLTAAHLIEEHSARRFRMHDLLRAYAMELARSEKSVVRRTALHRVLDHYAHSAWSADQRLYAYGAGTPPPAPQPGVTIRSHADYGDALEWFASEHRVLLAAVKQADAEGFDTHAWQLPSCLATYFDRRGYWTEYVSALHTAATAASRLGDRTMLARTLRGLGRANALLLDHAEALHCCRQALQIFEELHDVEGQARTHRMLSMIHQALHQYTDALTHGQKSRRLFQITGNKSGEARALHVIGWCSVEAGKPEEGLVHCLVAMRLFAELPISDTQGEASAVEGYAYALHRLERHTEAIIQYNRAIDLWRQLGNQFYEASTLRRLGAAYLGHGNTLMARQSWELAWQILADLNHRDAALVSMELANTHRNR